MTHNAIIEQISVIFIEAVLRIPSKTSSTFSKNIVIF